MPNLRGEIKDKAVGLGDRPKSEWPSVQTGKPIDKLVPKSKHHEAVLQYLVDRLEASEHTMGRFYPRWRANEKRVQAYIDLPNWEKTLKDLNDSGRPPRVVSVTVPYSYAVIGTIVTYMLHVFTGRKPMFQIGTYKTETAASSQNMQTVLQYQADHTRLIKHLLNFFQDAELYGFGALRNNWRVESALRTVRRRVPNHSVLGRVAGTNLISSRERRTVYSGNIVDAIDPFMFFPDPRVPLTEVNSKGEYVFWRQYIGKHELKKEEADGTFKWIDHVPTRMPRNTGEQDSVRSLLAGGHANPGFDLYHDARRKGGMYYQADQGTVEIIPRELGLGEEETPEKWIFTILNKAQIVQAEPFDADHGKHPVSVIEPRTMGYGLGNLGIADYLAPIQDVISWLVNSRMYNVRQVLNNMFVVDPSAIEMQDLKNPEAGKLIRLKRSAFGRDVRTIIQQLQTTDVTAGHTRDIELLFGIGEKLSAVTENLLGVQDSGGRKTATEVRTAGEAGGSRLAAEAKIISAQGIVDLTEQMSLNTQQYLDDDFYIQVLGQKGMEAPIHINPEMLVGDFYYPIHDGTLPLDRVAMLDVWKEIFLAVAQDQQLRQEYSLPKIFEWVAELGGAKNIDAMKLNIAPNEQLEQAEGAGNVVPLTSGSGASGLINALPNRPGDRAAGAI
jgi:hypothetical protein